MWTPQRQIISKILKGQRQTVTFKRDNDTRIITRTSSSCSCTLPEYDPETRTLKVTYRAKFPKSRTGRIYETTQIVTVYYDDRTVDKLSIRANVYRSW